MNASGYKISDMFRKLTLKSRLLIIIFIIFVDMLGSYGWSHCVHDVTCLPLE